MLWGFSTDGDEINVVKFKTRGPMKHIYYVSNQPLHLTAKKRGK